MYKLVFSFLLILASLSSSYCQKGAMIEVHKKDGDTFLMEFVLRRYKGDLIFPDDNKDILKGRIDGKKVKIPKEEIEKILVPGGEEYLFIKDTETDEIFIGNYVAQGNINLFKVYLYSHKSVASGEFFTPQSTINKIADLGYFLHVDGHFEKIDPKKFIKQKAESNSGFNEFVESKGKIKETVFDEILGKINDFDWATE